MQVDRTKADGWCWFVLREEYCWLVAGSWFDVREKYCWLVADKPSEQGEKSEDREPNSFLGPDMYVVIFKFTLVSAGLSLLSFKGRITG
jgi:hypothetical protein